MTALRRLHQCRPYSTPHGIDSHLPAGDGGVTFGTAQGHHLPVVVPEARARHGVEKLLAQIVEVGLFRVPDLAPQHGFPVPFRGRRGYRHPCDKFEHERAFQRFLRGARQKEIVKHRFRALLPD